MDKETYERLDQALVDLKAMDNLMDKVVAALDDDTIAAGEEAAGVDIGSPLTATVCWLYELRTGIEKAVRALEPAPVRPTTDLVATVNGMLAAMAGFGTGVA